MNEETAKNFIKRIQKQTNSQVYIMNESGKIIAGTNPKRIGEVQQAACEMVKNEQQVMIVNRSRQKESDMGKYALEIHLLLRSNLHGIGVISVSGNTEKDMEMAKVIRMSFETMLEFESQKRNLQQEQQFNSGLSYAMLFEQPLNEEKIQRLAREQNYLDKILRVPILMRIHGDYNLNFVNDVIFHYLKSEIHQEQDIVLQIDAGNLLLFKTVKEFSPAYFHVAMRAVCDFLDALIRMKCKGKDLKIQYFYAPPSTQLTEYRQCYDSLVWLSQHVEMKEYRTHSLQYHMLEYLEELCPKSKLESLFENYAEAVREQMDEEWFLKTVEAILECNMNIAQAADKLYVHKNTLSIRIKKIKNILDLDPFFNVRDAIFLMGLYYYMKKEAESGM